MKIKDFLNSGQFGVYGNVRIYSFNPKIANGGCVKKWEGDMGCCELPDADLMEREIDGMYITPVGVLEIEFLETEGGK